MASISKKDRVCTCTTTGTSGTSTHKTTYYKAKKHDVRPSCVGSQTESSSGSVTITGDKTTCELK
ncbi:MAG: hypothetical protein HYX39_00190 [Bacteroidetes bacterium]|nr:hypothetical protein [Bacteroidota bacterium]